MFTGIIESIGHVMQITPQGTNYLLRIGSNISNNLKIDQSLAHDGVCLTVVCIGDGFHEVVAIQETLEKTNIRDWKKGQSVNLERAMLPGSRLDGHMVQGHVDTTAVCKSVKSEEGSWTFIFELNKPDFEALIVPKGSICINGISLTLVTADTNEFSVAIIPYTYHNTNLHQIKVGDLVNIEFDIIGKYIQKSLIAYKSHYPSLGH
jgi:riboflavin synthase